MAWVPVNRGAHCKLPGSSSEKGLGLDLKMEVRGSQGLEAPAAIRGGGRQRRWPSQAIGVSYSRAGPRKAWKDGQDL